MDKLIISQRDKVTIFNGLVKMAVVAVDLDGLCHAHLMLAFPGD
jgi:hypothetical protein